MKLRLLQLRGRKAIEVWGAVAAAGLVVALVGSNLAGYAFRVWDCDLYASPPRDSCLKIFFFFTVLSSFLGVLTIGFVLYLGAGVASNLIEHWHDERRRVDEIPPEDPKPLDIKKIDAAFQKYFVKPPEEDA